MKRLDRPDKRWKYSTNDLPTRRQWDDYQAAYADVFRRTSTDAAPWYVIPADHKWYARLAITEILTQTLVDMDPAWPSVRWDPEVQRRRARRDDEHPGAACLARRDRPSGEEGREGRPQGAQGGRPGRQRRRQDDPLAEAEAEAREAEAAASAAADMLDLQRTRKQKADLLEERS